MIDPYEGTGFGWIALAFCGFVAGYLLAKLKVLTDKNTVSFCSWTAAVVAAVAAFSGGWENTSFTMLAGRVAIFAIIWFIFGIVFTIGVAMGKDKANKK